MAKSTITFGVLLIAVSIGFWVALERTQSAALHPAGIGLLLVVCGALASTDNPKKRMLWMHIAVTLGLIGLLTTGIRCILELANGTASVNPLGFDERALVAIICAIFVTMCIRSFVAARRARPA